MVFLYGYHKNFDQECIPKNADGIAIVDVKNIRNYVVFSYLKTPSEWKWETPFSKFNRCFDLSDFGIITPDYLVFFHIENQPLSQWFITLKIAEDSVFEKAIAKAHFHSAKLQNGMSFYYSNSTSFLIVKHLDQILVANISEKHKQIAVNVANDLFFKKLFLDTNKIEKNIGIPNMATIWIKKNTLLEEDGILNLKLEDQELTVDGQLKLKHKKEWHFSQNPNALLSFGFDFEMIPKQNILKRHLVQINKMIGFDLDSILSYNPTKTELLLNEIVEMKDSAVSYDYDDDFNAIKKVVVHTRCEPSFDFSMQTENSEKVYNYLKTQKAIDNHQVFVNFLFAQTKISIQNNALILEANPLKIVSSQISVPKIAYLRMQFGKLQPRDWRYIIAKNESFSILKSFESLKMDLSKANNAFHFQARLKTKDGKNLISVVK
jgi:hypothetical protein